MTYEQMLEAALSRAAEAKAELEARVAAVASEDADPSDEEREACEALLTARDAAEADAVRYQGLITQRDERAAAMEGYASIVRVNDEPKPQERESMVDALAVEARATVVVPTFVKTDETFGDEEIPLVGDDGFIGLFDVAPSPYLSINHTVHSFGDVSFAAGAEASNATESEPALANRVVTTSKQDLFFTVSIEHAEAVPAADAQLRRRISRASLRHMRTLIAGAVEGSTDGDNLVLAGLVPTFAELNTALASAEAELENDLIWLFDRATIAGIQQLTDNGGLLFDPETGKFNLLGIPVHQAPLTGGSGNVVGGLVLPEAVSIRASELRVGNNDSIGFRDETRAYRASMYTGATVNADDYVTLLTAAT